MSKGYPGSVVLTQNSTGVRIRWLFCHSLDSHYVFQHTSISGPSTCTMDYVRAYFENGTLPEEGTVCQVLGPPIPQFNSTQPHSRRDMSSWHENRATIDAIIELSRKRHILGSL